jgi:hypothetical protein
MSVSYVKCAKTILCARADTELRIVHCLSLNICSYFHIGFIKHQSIWLISAPNLVRLCAC